MRLGIGAAVLAAAALATVSCGGSVTDPSQNQTQTFTGSITPAKLGGNGQGANHMFNVSNGGEYTIKVTAMDPNFNSTFGVTLAQGSACNVLVNQSLVALVGVQALTGPIYQTGQYCVQIYDYYNLMTSVENYTLTVNHP